MLRKVGNKIKEKELIFCKSPVDLEISMFEKFKKINKSTVFIKNILIKE